MKECFIINIKALWAIYLRGLIILRQRWTKVLVSLFLSPMLYALAFGWGVGRGLEVENVSYLTFMLPGLAAMSGMNQSFSIAQEMNVSRFLSYFFEEYLLSPAMNWIIVLGNVLYGVTKGILSFCAIILIGFVFGIRPSGGWLVLIPVIMNCFLFASLSVWISLLVKNHRDMNSFQSFVILPMSFIGGTVFSLKALPPFFSVLAELIPLTHSSVTIRALFLGLQVQFYHFIIMAAYFVFFFIMAVKQVRKAVP